ncbi:MAG TPA: hypothetical protein VFV79_11170 [Saprospiraceae bacterium]|nr:hypothetical protein [Saprospiraceae bacterium]
MPPPIITPGFHATLYENPRPIIWTWPVHVSLIKADPAFVDQLQSAHWTERFAIFHNDEQPADYGIVLEPHGFSTCYDHFHANYQFQNTGIAIIFEEDTFFTHETPTDELKQKVQEVADAMKFSGVLIIPRPVDPVGWLNYLFENLAHNLNIIEVIQKTAKRGYLFYDSKVEEETKLISVLHGIEAGMDPTFFNPDEPLQFYSRITGNTQMKPAELKSFIGEAIRQLRFDHESEGATILAEMTKGLYEHYGELRLNTHVKNFMWYQSPPPDEVGVDEPGEAASRYLHAKICNKDDAQKINLPHLAPETDYDAFIKISVPDTTWTSSNTAVNQEMIFAHSQKEEEELTIQWMTDVNEPVQSQTLKIPRKGNTEEVRFSLTTKNKKDEFVAKIFIYHGVRLIQIAELKSAIVTKDDMMKQSPPTALNVLFSATSDAESLEKSKAFVRSFHVNSSEKGIALLDTANEKYALPDNPQLMKLINRIRIDIENAAKNTDKETPPLTAEENVTLLRRLAIKGNDLAENYLRHDVPEGPIQIVTQQQEFVPLDYVYTLPPPEANANLCDHAAEALRKGSCMNCHDFSKSPSPFICPFGFWGLSRVIERFRYEGTTSTNTQFASFYIGKYDQPTELPVLQNSLHASTIKTEKYEPGLRATVFKTIESNSKQSLWAHSWEEWGKHIQSDIHPESLLLIVHTEVDPDLDAVQMEIEDANFLVKNYLNEQMISSDAATKPIVIVLGCSTSDLQDQTFDISSQFLNHGAQYVISNFTKIRGQQAGKIMIRLVEFMKLQTQQRSTLGETMLRLRQHLLADGIMVSLAMIAHGDALQFVKS